MESKYPLHTAIIRLDQESIKDTVLAWCRKSSFIHSVVSEVSEESSLLLSYVTKSL